ncbi:MAG: hypothetical protein QOJ99_721 [Bryobacterales bacterium]|nr:hypothetical protein [Bryobacterales bacterium]
MRAIVLSALLHTRFLLISSLVLTFAGTLPAQGLYRKPLKVLGDPQFIGTASNPTQITNIGPNVVEGREFSFPSGIAVDSSVSPPVVYISDAGNNRVLGFQYSTQLRAGAIADVVIGQVDRFGNLSSAQNGRSTTGLNLPSGLAVDPAGNLYIADSGNNRIVRYPKPVAQPGGQQFPDLVIGQTSFSGRTANPNGVTATSLSLSGVAVPRTGIAFDAAGNLWVADSGNNRVLRYQPSALKANQNGPSADLVVGQADFVSRVQATTANSKTGLLQPQGLAFDPAGRLLVTDGGPRVVVYPPAIGSNAVAIRILGIDAQARNTGAPTQISLAGSYGVAATSTGVIVTDSLDNRVLIFPPVDSWPAESVQFSPSATAVLGQSGFNTRKPNQGNGDASASSLNLPLDVASSGSELYVADAGNNRVLVYPAGPGGVSAAASRVIGQLDFPFSAVNLIEGREFAIAPPSSNSPSGSAILDQSSTPAHLYVADTQNNRILGYKDFSSVQNGQKADLVIGQPDFLRNVVNYPSGDVTQPNAQGLHSPTSLTVDSAGNLYVADTGNSRIVRFPAPFASGKNALESADLVIGQTGFNSIVNDPSDRTMSAPISIALTADAANATVENGGWLIAVDANHNRALFFPKPFSNGMSANKVLGSSNFTSISAGSSDPPRFNSPRGVAVDPQDRVLIADTGNRRVQIFNKAGAINSFDTPPISLNTQFSVPLAISATGNGFWVADSGQNAVAHFPSIDQLPLKNNASDAALPATAPISAYVDTYGNLLVGDGDNRVLYFGPQLDVVNAATYSTRPLAAGTIAAVFPHANAGQPVANVIANGTGSALAAPLPTALSDTQLLVNGTPAPLFFVSPGQINTVFSNSLPTGGTADLLAIRPSTGQIYGGAEVQLNSASPGFFTSNQAGTGQIIAANVADNSLNSSLNPVVRGQYITLYGTGVGQVPNAPVDGAAPTGPLPAASIPQVLIGNAKTFLPDANIQYSGLNPTLVGVWQLNILIPQDAPTGSVAIKVFMNSIASIDPSSGTATTTIAIK